MFENPNVILSALRKPYAKIACCSSELVFMLLDASGSIKNAIEKFVSCIRLPSINFKQFSVGHRSELDTCSFELLFSQ